MRLENFIEKFLAALGFLSGVIAFLSGLIVPEQMKRIKSWGPKQELQCFNCSRIKNTSYNSYLGSVDVSKS
jgi:hypothetical protein